MYLEPVRTSRHDAQYMNTSTLGEFDNGVIHMSMEIVAYKIAIKTLVTLLPPCSEVFQNTRQQRDGYVTTLAG